MTLWSLVNPGYGPIALNEGVGVVVRVDLQGKTGTSTYVTLLGQVSTGVYVTLQGRIS